MYGGPLPPGKNPFAVQLNKNINSNKVASVAPLILTLH
jgi:hypothetical protein